jgi:hypothetical protein
LGVNPKHGNSISISTSKILLVLSPAQAMKSIIVLLPLLASAAPSIERRQLGIFTAAPGTPEKPIKVTKGEASLYDGSIREKQLYGPFKVSAANSTHAKVDPNVLKLDPTSDLVWKGIGGVSLQPVALPMEDKLILIFVTALPGLHGPTSPS